MILCENLYKMEKNTGLSSQKKLPGLFSMRVEKLRTKMKRNSVLFTKNNRNGKK